MAITPRAVPGPGSRLALASERLFQVHLIPAGDSADLDAARAIRFQVFCHDRRFLDPQRFPDGRERDDFDSRALHVLVRDPQGRPAATARLILSAVPGDLPCESHCLLTHQVVAGLDRTACGEISRLAVLAAHKVHSPLALAAIYRGLFQTSQAAGIRWWFAAMEDAHHRALAGLGLDVTPIGPHSDYYGPVRPVLIDLIATEGRLAKDDPALLAWLRHG